MANIEHSQTVHVPASKVYETLTTAEGLSEIWTNELIINNQVGFINEMNFDSAAMTPAAMRPKPRHLPSVCLL